MYLKASLQSSRLAELGSFFAVKHASNWLSQNSSIYIYVTSAWLLRVTYDDGCRPDHLLYLLPASSTYLCSQLLYSCHSIFMSKMWMDDEWIKFELVVNEVWWVNKQILTNVMNYKKTEDYKLLAGVEWQGFKTHITSGIEKMFPDKMNISVCYSFYT